jgi:hypothetical protein
MRVLNLDKWGEWFFVGLQNWVLSALIAGVLFSYIFSILGLTGITGFKNKEAAGW